MYYVNLNIENEKICMGYSFRGSLNQRVFVIKTGEAYTSVKTIASVSEMKVYLS